MSGSTHAGPPGGAGMTLGQKLEYLLDRVRVQGRRYTDEELARRIASVTDGQVTISAKYLWQLRTGRSDNPSLKVLQGLAKAFAVPACFFTDDDEAVQRVQQEVDLLVALQDSQITTLALRAAKLSPGSLAAITTMVDQVSALENQRDPKR